MQLTKARKGELYIFAEAFLWAFFPIFSIIVFILGEIPTIWQILGLLPMILGVMFLTGYNLKNRRNPQNTVK